MQKNSSHREEWECESKNSETKVNEEEERGGAPGLEAPATHAGDHGEAAVLLQPMKVHSGSEIHLQSVQDFILE